MEASAYAWIVIVIFFVVYATIQIRKCFLQILSSHGSNNASRLDQFSASSVYTIESASDRRAFRTNHEILRSMDKMKDNNDLPTYEQVIAGQLNQNTVVTSVSVGTSTSTDVIPSSETNNR